MSKQHQLHASSPACLGKRVLVMGHRPQIAKTLDRLGIPFAIWHDKPIRSPPDCLKVRIADFPATPDRIRDGARREFERFGAFTHVIAGTEAAVYAASVARRALSARVSIDSVALSCHDKRLMKARMSSHGIPMTEYVTAARWRSARGVFEQLGPRVIIKQRRNSGGRGVTLAHSAEEIMARNEPGLLYERYVDANEMSIETFVRDGSIRFTSTTNYLVKRHVNIVPCGLPPDVVERALAINRRVIEALRLGWGLTHAEYYWSDDGVLFGEVALRPPGGYIMDCISLAHGIDAWEAFVANELELPYEFPVGGGRTAGAVLLHAGEGRLEAIHDVEAARNLPHCVRFKILVAPGDRIAARVGVSEASAYALFASDSAHATESSALSCLDLVRFELS